MEKNHEIDEEITVTSNVESPGDINLSAIFQFLIDNSLYASSGILVIAMLFGEVDVKGIKFKGLVPSIHNRKIQNLEKRKLTVEVEKMEKDSELDDIKRDIEIEKSRKALQEIRNMDITIDNPTIFYENESQKQMDLNAMSDEE
ncbi:hypothetical protein AAFF39_03905 [Lactococcus garvieae]